MTSFNTVVRIGLHFLHRPSDFDYIPVQDQLRGGHMMAHNTVYLNNGAEVGTDFFVEGAPVVTTDERGNRKRLLGSIALASGSRRRSFHLCDDGTILQRTPVVGSTELTDAVQTLDQTQMSTLAAELEELSNL